MHKQYKYPEGSDWERRALYSGYKELIEAQYDVEFEVPEVKHKFGEDVTLEVVIKNKNKQHRVRGCISCKATSYTGAVLRKMEQLPVDIKVNKGRAEVIKMTINGSIYTEFHGTRVFLQFDVMLAVHGHAQVFATEVQVAPPPPEIKIEAPGKLGLGSLAKALITFKNPLPVKMENITLNIESDDVLDGKGYN